MIQRVVPGINDREPVAGEKAEGEDMVAVSSLPAQVRRRLATAQKKVKDKELAEDNEREKNFEDLRQACFDILVTGETFYAVAKRTKFDHKLLRRSCETNDATSVLARETFVRAKIGRPFAVADEVMVRLTTHIAGLDHEGSTAMHKAQVKAESSNIGDYDPNTVIGSFPHLVHTFLHEYVNAQYPDGQAPLAQLVRLSDKILDKVRQLVAPEIIKMKQRGQNQRRSEALCDAYNFTSLGAMIIVAQSQMANIPILEMEAMSVDELQSDARWKAGVDRRLIFNVDKSSTFLGDDAAETIGFASAGSKKYMKERARDHSFTKTGDEDVRRSIGYTALTSASGDLDFFVTHVKDHTLSGKSKENPRKATLTMVGLEPHFHYLFAI
jgi:hypothetical protein